MTVEKPNEPDIPLEIAISDFALSPETGRVILRIDVNRPATISIGKSNDLYTWQTIREFPVEAGTSESQDRLDSPTANAYYRVTGITR